MVAAVLETSIVQLQQQLVRLQMELSVLEVFPLEFLPEDVRQSFLQIPQLRKGPHLAIFECVKDGFGDFIAWIGFKLIAGVLKGNEPGLFSVVSCTTITVVVGRPLP